MYKLVLVVIIAAFIFLISYDPKNGKKLKAELYQPAETQKGPSCDESRYLELQGLTGTCSGHPTEMGGAIFSR
jgi:hypothetical protein